MGAQIPSDWSAPAPKIVRGEPAEFSEVYNPGELNFFIFDFDLMTLDGVRYAPAILWFVIFWKKDEIGATKKEKQGGPGPYIIIKNQILVLRGAGPYEKIWGPVQGTFGQG